MVSACVRIPSSGSAGRSTDFEFGAQSQAVDSVRSIHKVPNPATFICLALAANEALAASPPPAVVFSPDGAKVSLAGCALTLATRIRGGPLRHRL